MLDQHHNPEPYIEIRLKQDVPLFQPVNTSQKPPVADVKGSERYTAGDRPVDLYQRGPYESCLSVFQACVVYARRLYKPRCAQAEHAHCSRAALIVLQAIQKSLPSLRCLSRPSYIFRLGIPGILGSITRFSSINGAPVLDGSAVLPRLTSSSCVVCETPWNE